MTKIVLIGPRGSGKTALAIRLSKNEFNSTQTKQTGTQFFQRNIASLEIKQIQLDFWDVECREQTMKIFLESADIVLCLFSLSDSNSLRRLKNEILAKESLKTLLRVSNAICCLVGTHSDCPHRVTQQEITNVSAEANLQYFSISSKTGLHSQSLLSFLQQGSITLFRDKLAQCEQLKSEDLFSQKTKYNLRLTSAKSEGEYLWRDHKTAEQNIRTVLHDYALANNGWHLVSSQHANRHHTWQVDQIVRQIDIGELSNVADIFTALEQIKGLKKDGALSLRLTFLTQKLGLSNNDEEVEIEEIDPVSQGPLSCCRLFFDL